MKPERIVLFAFVCLLPLSSTAEWITWEPSEGGNGHSYLAVQSQDLINWDMASKKAIKLGGYLATLTSQAENDFVFALASDPKYWVSSNGPLLGGYQRPGSQEPAGGWAWVTGESWIFHNWEERQPDNSGGELGPDEIIHFYGPSGKWNDHKTNALAFVGFVVEREPQSPVVFIRTSEVEISWFADRDKIYQVQYSSELTEGQWIPFMNPIVGVGAIYTTHDTVKLGEPRRFYRVVPRE